MPAPVKISFQRAKHYWESHRSTASSVITTKEEYANGKSISVLFSAISFSNSQWSRRKTRWAQSWSVLRTRQITQLRFLGNMLHSKSPPSTIEYLRKDRVESAQFSTPMIDHFLSFCHQYSEHKGARRFIQTWVRAWKKWIFTVSYSSWIKTHNYWAWIIAPI